MTKKERLLTCLNKGLIRHLNKKEYLDKNTQLIMLLLTGGLTITNRECNVKPEEGDSVQLVSKNLLGEVTLNFTMDEGKLKLTLSADNILEDLKAYVTYILLVEKRNTLISVLYNLFTFSDPMELIKESETLNSELSYSIETKEVLTDFKLT